MMQTNELYMDAVCMLAADIDSRRFVVVPKFNAAGYIEEYNVYYVNKRKLLRQVETGPFKKEHQARVWALAIGNHHIAKMENDTRCRSEKNKYKK